MVPTTLSGRIFCIAFGLFGIPLLLITIADIGKFLSDGLTLIYKAYLRFKWRVNQKKRMLSLKRRHWQHHRRGTDGNDILGVQIKRFSHFVIYFDLVFLNFLEISHEMIETLRNNLRFYDFLN